MPLLYILVLRTYRYLLCVGVQAQVYLRTSLLLILLLCGRVRAVMCDGTLVRTSYCCYALLHSLAAWRAETMLRPTRLKHG